MSRFDKLSVIAAIAAGRPVEFLFFPDAGTMQDPLTASCLSQWALTPFTRGGVQFHSAEQAMMYGKAQLFEDAETAERIAACRTPFQAKNLGRLVKGFTESRWSRHRVEVVVAANLPKYQQNPALLDFLLSTGDAVLAEASSTDFVWGTGLDEFDPSARSPARWPGLNLLGFALMDIRERLRPEQ